MSKRILVNLGVFGLLFVGLAVWTFTNVISIAAIDRPYRVTAEFATLPGLRPDFEVAYLGRTVGSIGRVELARHRVEVVLEIDRGVVLPADVSAAVRRKSAVGEPFVDLAPFDGSASGGPPYLEGGDRIPIERTTTPLSYAELFDAIDDLVAAVPVDDLRTLIHELSLGLDGRSTSLRTILQSADDLTGTLAENAPLLDQVVTELTRLTNTVAAHGGDVASTLDSLALVAATLRSSTADLVSIVEATPGFADQLSALVAEAGGDLGCTLDSLAVVVGGLSTDEHLSELVRLLQASPTARDALRDVYVQGPDGPYIQGSLSINAGADAIPIFEPLIELPAAPGIPTCGQVAAPGGGVGPEDQAGAGGQVAPSALDTPADSSARREAGRETPASSEKEPGGGRNLLVLAGVAAVLAAGAALLFATRPWRLLLARRGGGGGR
ncbi:MAG: MCE family protein [Acidimicrobiales bacterium]